MGEGEVPTPGALTGVLSRDAGVVEGLVLVGVPVEVGKWEGHRSLWEEEEDRRSWCRILHCCCLRCVYPGYGLLMISSILMSMLASSPGSLRVSHWRAWYFFSRDLADLIACGQDRSKDSCTSLSFASDIVSALGLCSAYDVFCSFVPFRSSL